MGKETLEDKLITRPSLLSMLQASDLMVSAVKLVALKHSVENQCEIFTEIERMAAT